MLIPVCSCLLLVVFPTNPLSNKHENRTLPGKISKNECKTKRCKYNRIPQEQEIYFLLLYFLFSDIPFIHLKWFKEKESETLCFEKVNFYLHVNTETVYVIK